jgi:ABC-type transporter Mla subunit MlaD
VSGQPRQGKRALLGGAIIGALIALAGGIFLLDDILAALRAPYEVVAVLPQAPRLAAGSRVWVGGKDVGEVRSVALLPAGGDGSGRVALALSLPAEVREQVRQDSRVRITAVNTMGAPVVDIVPGSTATAPLAPGDTLRSARLVDRAAVLARSVAFRASLDSALSELRALRAPLEQRLAGLQRATAQLAAASREYRRLQAALAASPLVASVGSGELNASLARSRTTVAALLAALADAQQRVRSSGLDANFKAMTARAGALQRSLAELQSEMREGGGTLDRLARDSALVRAIAAARTELDSLLVEARRNPLRFVF